MIALIPARGGSKGLPGKNIRPLHGQPLINYSIQAALNSEFVSRVIVSTDSEEIAAIARIAGAEVPFLRPQELATDSSVAIDTYIYCCERLGDLYHQPINELVVLLPTSPLRTAEDIDKAIRLFKSNSADSVISVTEMSQPISWAKKIDSDGILREYFTGQYDNKLANRQECQIAYVPNGSIYVLKYSLLKDKRNYYSDKTFPYVMPRERSIDIDDMLDFDMAEFFMQRRGIT
jgi:N-acylneuraminate cytidylyltransferase/CMP-N,N'-diacetyllegionaminic acid synthase